MKTRGTQGPALSSFSFPRPAPTPSSPGLPGAETLSSPGPGVSHQEEEAVTERTARVAHSRGLAAPDRRLRAQGRAPGPRGPQRAPPPPASPPLNSAPSRPYPRQLQRQAPLRTEKTTPSLAVSCPRGRGFPSRAGGQRPRAADPSGEPLGCRAGIPELAPECACGRGGEGRGGEFPPPGGRVAAATRSGPHGRPGTPASPAPARCPHALPRRPRRPGAPLSHRVGLGGRRNAGPRPPVIFKSPRQQPGARKGRDKRTLGRESPHPLAPPAPGPALTRSGGRSRW